MADEKQKVATTLKAVRLEQDINIERAGIEKTQFFYSYSGVMLIDGALPPVTGVLNEFRFDVEEPKRIASPSFRPTPQLDFDSVTSFFKVDIPTPFPLQVNASPAASTEEGASAGFWFGPAQVIPEGGPPLPPDTLLVTYYGPSSPKEGPNIERHILKPFFEWLRVLSRQWWVGRSTEGAAGSLHFVAPLDKAGATVGSPTPVMRFTTAGSGMRPITPAIWTEAWERGFRGEIPRADKSLEMDADFAIASGEFRSGIILACSSIEAARDSLLTRIGAKISQMKTSETDLLKHLSVGLEKVASANLEKARPDLFAFAKAFWCARGEAAHGRPVRWRLDGVDCPIEDVKIGSISDNLALILKWLDALPTPA